MTDEITEEITEDSTGATEVETPTQDSEGSTATHEDEASELEVFQVGEIQVSADEIKDWKAAFEKKRDTDATWTQKTQALSADRKKLEAAQESLDQKLEMLGTLESEIESLVLGDLKEVDLDKLLADQGTEEYLRMQREVDRRKGGLGSLSTKFKDIQNQYYQEAFSQLSDQLGWTSDPEKQQADKQAINSYVKDAGITEREFAKVTSPKVMTALLEASKYRELMKDKEETRKKVVQAPKVSKPAASQEKKPKTLAQRMYPNM